MLTATTRKRGPVPKGGTPATGAIVVAWRSRMDFTQQEAADWYGVSLRQWRRYERGESRVPRPLWKAMSGRLARSARRRIAS